MFRWVQLTVYRWLKNPHKFRLLRKYSLEMYLLAFLQTGLFPHKHQWKTLVRNVITGKAESEWYSRMFGNVFLRYVISIKSFYSYYNSCELNSNLKKKIISVKT